MEAFTESSKRWSAQKCVKNSYEEYKPRKKKIPLDNLCELEYSSMVLNGGVHTVQHSLRGVLVRSRWLDHQVSNSWSSGTIVKKDVQCLERTFAQFGFFMDSNFQRLEKLKKKDSLVSSIINLDKRKSEGRPTVFKSVIARHFVATINQILSDADSKEFKKTQNTVELRRQLPPNIRKFVNVLSYMYSPVRSKQMALLKKDTQEFLPFSVMQLYGRASLECLITKPDPHTLKSYSLFVSKALRVSHCAPVEAIWGELIELQEQLTSIANISGDLGTVSHESEQVKLLVAMRAVLEKKFAYRIVIDGLDMENDADISSMCRGMSAVTFRDVVYKFCRKHYSNSADECLVQFHCIKAGRWDSAVVTKNGYEGINIVLKALEEFLCLNVVQRQYFSSACIIRMITDRDISSLSLGSLALLLTLAPLHLSEEHIDVIMKRITKRVCLYPEDYIWLRLSLLRPGGYLSLHSLSQLQRDVLEEKSGFFSEHSLVSNTLWSPRSLFYTQLFPHFLRDLHEKLDSVHVIHLALGLRIMGVLETSTESNRRSPHIFNVSQEIIDWLNQYFQSLNLISPQQLNVDTLRTIRLLVPYYAHVPCHHRAVALSSLIRSLSEVLRNELIGNIDDHGTVHRGILLESSFLDVTEISSDVSTFDPIELFYLEEVAHNLERSQEFIASMNLWLQMSNACKQDSANHSPSAAVALYADRGVRSFLNLVVTGRTPNAQLGHYWHRLNLVLQRSEIQLSHTLYNNFTAIMRLLEILTYLKQGEDFSQIMTLLQSHEWFPRTLDDIHRSTTCYNGEVMEPVAMVTKSSIAYAIQQGTILSQKQAGATAREIEFICILLRRWAMHTIPVNNTLQNIELFV